jgi:LmbE family N-acetylglucosaminyl deacetylase
MMPLGSLRPRRVLVIGAHADDIEIGCGGTLLMLLECLPGIEITWVVLTGSPDRQAEARNSARAYLDTDRLHVLTPGFDDGFLPHTGRDCKLFFESLKGFQPDLIFTHARPDLHQDHRFSNELTWNTFRDHAILEYEIPKFDGDLGQPNYFVPLSDAQAQKKVELLHTHFATQRGKHWFDPTLFFGLMRLRGMECRHAGCAEAFIARKVVI